MNQTHWLKAAGVCGLAALLAPMLVLAQGTAPMNKKPSPILPRQEMRQEIRIDRQEKREEVRTNVKGARGGVRDT